MHILPGETLQGLHLARRDITAEEHRRHQPEEQGDATRQTETDNQRHLQLLPFHFLIDHLPQCQHRQQGNGELGNDEDRCHRPELRIHRHVVEEEVRQSHEVLTPREHDRQHSGRQQRPLHWSLHDKEPQDKQEHHESTHIDGATRAGLLTPVLSDLVVETQEIIVGLLHRRLITAQGYRSTALRIGHQ